MPVNSIIRRGDLLLFCDELTQNCFSEAPVWCDYRYPDELEVMRACGAESPWLEDTVMDFVERHPFVWYAKAGSSIATSQEVIAVSAAITIGDHICSGYLTLVMGHIASATVFSPAPDPLIFSLCAELAQENSRDFRTLTARFGVNETDLKSTSFAASVPCGKMTDRVGILEIPLAPGERQPETSS